MSGTLLTIHSDTDRSEDWLSANNNIIQKKYKGLTLSAKLAVKVRAARAKETWVSPPGYGRDMTWEPPRSPYNLFEEELYRDPWRLFIGCVFHQKTTSKVALPILNEFFRRWPTPEATIAARVDDLACLLRPMGLHRLRASQIIRLSKDYRKPWSSPRRDLYGVGKYAEDAWRIFCCGDLSTRPSDVKLYRYLAWLTSTTQESSNNTERVEHIKEKLLSSNGLNSGFNVVKDHQMKNLSRVPCARGSGKENKSGQKSKQILTN